MPQQSNMATVIATASTPDRRLGRCLIRQPPAQSLSGGNQQKVVLGRWLAANVRTLLLDEPTKGIDIEAKAALYGLLREVVQAGVSVMIAPTELEELFLVCDRVLILQRGSVIAQLPVAKTTPQNVMRLALSGETES